MFIYPFKIRRQTTVSDYVDLSSQEPHDAETRQRTWVVERENFTTQFVALKSKNQEINRLQLAVKLPWTILFET
ncbi:hypothetical protein TNCV_3184571 [Trichonephila clavipes]|nr:hypothetical protein TNCV_3184571 [Trichonephila clavipes]